MDAKVIRDGEGRFIMEGQECTQVYAHTDKLIFSVSTLLPGQQACLDQGHDEAHETVYVIQGTLMIHLPDSDQFFKLNPGDCLLIPPGEAHYSINVGEEKSIAAWSCAPHL
ncbi:MAG: cupin domain-containing protein [Spirochaetales bacterium]|nr:cupin domain-containing protein [Spirochaetales bacterium]